MLRRMRERREAIMKQRFANHGDNWYGGPIQQRTIFKASAHTTQRRGRTAKSTSTSTPLCRGAPRTLTDMPDVDGLPAAAAQQLRRRPRLHNERTHLRSRNRHTCTHRHTSVNQSSAGTVVSSTINSSRIRNNSSSRTIANSAMPTYLGEGTRVALVASLGGA